MHHSTPRAGARSALRPAPRRVVVLGSSGSGKTTFARALASTLAAPCVELDALHWGAHWTPVPPATFRARVAAAAAAERWVIDGNYSAVRDLLWQQADTLVWLDYPLWLVFARLLPRTLRRVLRREQLWSGNRERLWQQFFSRDSLFLWVLQTFHKRRREYPALLREPAYAHLRLVRARLPAQAERWLQRQRAVAGTAAPTAQPGTGDADRWPQ